VLPGIVEALQPIIDWKLPFLKWVDQFGPKFQVKGTSPPTICAWTDRPVMPYNFAAESFHSKKLYSRLSLRKAHFCTKIGHFAFWGPSDGSLGETFAVHLRLIGNQVVDFLLVIIELFLQVFSFCHNAHVWRTDRQTDIRLYDHQYRVAYNAAR